MAFAESFCCPYCGSREIQPAVPAEQNGAVYHCSSCGRDFGAALLNREGTPVWKIMTGFFFAFGSRSSATVQLQITALPDGSAMAEVSGAGKQLTRKLTKQQWQQFRLAMHTDLCLNDWEENYQYDPQAQDGPAVLDGSSWDLSIIVSTGEELQWHGMMAYPKNWDVLADLAEPYLKLIR